MKKILALIMSLAVSAVAFAGCSSKNEDSSSKKDESSANVSSPDSLMTGLGVVTSIGSSRDAEDGEDGLGQIDSTVAAVTVDANGKIVDCIIDAAQTKISFSAEGKITSDLTAPQKSKLELGDEYGMKEYSGIKKEWYEQIASFCEYVKGKTLDEVKGISVDDAGVPTGDDLKASVTIKVKNYISAIEKAYNNAKDFGAMKGDKLSLALTTDISSSSDASVDEENEEVDGQAYANTTYTAVTFDANNKITSSVIDVSQSSVNFDKEGKITSDFDAAIKTKLEKGDDYGMKPVSGIKKEWFEQIASFNSYVRGKTIEEVKAIKVDDKTVPTETDLTSSVTMKIGSYVGVLEKAANNAK